MATLDDIMGGSGSLMGRKPVQVSPPPIDVSLPGASTSVGSQPAAQSSQTSQSSQPSQSVQPLQPIRQPEKDMAAQQTNAAGTDATKLVGTPGISSQTGETPRLSYVKMYELMNPNKPETAEERAKREKREKSEAILSAVGDGISALSNLFFTTQYAPNAYDASKGLSAKAKERWDRLRLERETNQRAYLDGYLRAVAMDRAGEREDRNWRHTLEREKIIDRRADAAENRAERKAEQDEQIFQARLALQTGKLTEQGYRNRIAEIKAGKMEELTDAQINRLNRTGTGKAGGGGRPGEYPWYDSDGNLHYAHSYEAARQNALQHGTWNERTQTSTQTKTQTSGRKTTTTITSTTKPTKGTSQKPDKWSNTSQIKW